VVALLLDPACRAARVLPPDRVDGHGDRTGRGPLFRGYSRVQYACFVALTDGGDPIAIPQLSTATGLSLSQPSHQTTRAIAAAVSFDAPLHIHVHHGDAQDHLQNET
jgi:hypothetical protein